jgi:hypothetical protein
MYCKQNKLEDWNYDNVFNGAHLKDIIIIIVVVVVFVFVFVVLVTLFKLVSLV